MSDTKPVDKLLVFYIPVGNMPAKDVPAYIAAIVKDFDKSETKLPENIGRLFLPRRPDGAGPDVKLMDLNGSKNLELIRNILESGELKEVT